MEEKEQGGRKKTMTSASEINPSKCFRHQTLLFLPPSTLFLFLKRRPLLVPLCRLLVHVRDPQKI